MIPGRAAPPERVEQPAKPPRHQRARNPALDGLRGIAVAIVVLYHFPTSRWFPGGWVGVDIFFVLSGFLITTLLVQEWQESGRISIVEFYRRRAARLLPAVFAFLFVWVVVFLAVGDASWFWTVPGAIGAGANPPADAGALVASGIASSVFYVINWVLAIGGTLPPIGHLWSLAVEEQFYLLWPPAVVLALRWRGIRGLRQATAAFAVATGAWGVGLWLAGVSPQRLHFGTDVRIVGILVGAAVALWHFETRLDSIARPRIRSALAVLGCLVLLWIALNVTEGDQTVRAFFGPIALAAVAVLVFVVEHPASLGARLLATDTLTWLGRRSYAVYLWHYPLATWTRGAGWAGAAAGIAASLVLAELSWRFVEVRGKDWVLRTNPS